VIENQTETQVETQIETQIAAERDEVVVRPRGELDVFGSWCLAEAIEDALRPDVRCVVVDLRDVTLCDSSGVSALVRAGHLCHALGADLRVEGATGVVQRVLEWSRLDEALALEAIGQGAGVRP
jgi:anti-sigma B factor antagonist